MILLLWFCVIHVFGEKGHGVKESEEKKEQRFVVEDDFKPALFGSYSYDPIKQVFVLPQRNGTSTTMTQIVNNTYIKSTAVGEVTDSSATKATNVFRNAFANNLLHTTQWWQRKDRSNLKLSLNALNLPNFKAKTDNLLMEDKAKESLEDMEKDSFKDKKKMFP